ncbi:hypothetical protein WJ06_10405 [Burkholderia cepacia]|nr:hypothetical protein WJ06_10405 [Burkholderia cepacia]
MPVKSSLVTGGITIGALDLVPTVDWVLGGCKGPVPASLSSLIAGLVAVVIHAAVDWLNTRANRPAPYTAIATLGSPATQPQSAQQ